MRLTPAVLLASVTCWTALSDADRRSLRIIGILLVCAASAWCDCSGSVQYTIGNTQEPTLACQITATGGAFVYTSSVAYTTPANPPRQWLSVSPASGTIAAGANGVIDYNIDPTGLPTGDYYATVALHAPGFTDSSDQVHLTVVGGTSTTSISITLPSVQGITIIIDGATYTSSQTFLWIVGSVHTISVPAITGPGGTQTTFNISTSIGSAMGNPLQVTIPAGGMTITASQVTTPAPSTYTISTFAGGGLPVNMPGTSASLYGPNSVAVDKAGNIFFTDDNDVLRLDATTGVLTLVAGNGTGGFSGDNGPAASAQLNFLGFLSGGVAIDPAGNLYIADSNNNRIRKVSNGVITTIAGNGTRGFSGDNGSATSAQLNQPVDVAVDPAGNLYIGDTGNNRIRKVSNGVITTVAGNGNQGFSGDNGPATSAQLNLGATHGGVAADAQGNLYIGDAGNYRIRKVSNGIITTIAGNGTQGFSGDNGPATSAEMSYPNGVAADPAGNLYIADSNGYVRKVANGVISTLSEVPYNQVSAVAADPAGNLYVSVTGSILKVANAVVTTVAGNGAVGFSGDNGPATSSQLNSSYALIPTGGVAVGSAGDVYIADFRNNRIRKVSHGVITTVAGNGTQGFSGDNGPAASAQLNGPAGIAVDAVGNLYIADSGNYRVRKVANGAITTVAGNGTAGFGGDSGPAASAQLSIGTGVAVDSAGNLYIADAYNQRVRKVSNGVITTVAGSGSTGSSSGGFGGDNGPATSALLNTPVGVTVDSAGNLYIADAFNQRVRKVSNGVITTVAGNGTEGFSGDNGPATSTLLNYPSGVEVDSSDNLYILDIGNYRVRKVSNGVITTVAGNGTGGFGGDNGPATSAQLLYVNGIAADSAGNLYIADGGNNRIRLLTPSTTPKIAQNGVVPVYSSTPVVQPGSWTSIYGIDLASTTTLWDNDFPTSLGGTSVTIDNKPAYLWVVSPTQINLQVPDDSTTGLVSVAVTTPSGTATSAVTLAPQAPSFSLLGDNKHVAAEIATPNGTGAYGGGTYDLVGPSNTFSFTTRPVKAGETLILFGVGFGPTTPAVPAGKVFSGSAPTINPVTVTIGGVKANISFSGITEAGLYQINLTVPSTPSGDQPLQATVNGVQTPAGPVVTVQ